MSARRHDELEDAYSPVEGPEVWPLLGLLFFAASVLSKPLVSLLPRDLRPYPFGVLLPVAVSLVAAATGLLCAWAGWRRSRTSALARIALLTNGAVVALTLLVTLALAWIFRR